MSDSDDLFEMYSTDRKRSAVLKGDALSAALVETVKRTFAAIEGLAAEVEQALAKARYTIRLDSSITDRSNYVRLDRKSESFRDYLRTWAHERAESGGAMHWEAKLTVSDTRRQSGEVGLGIVFDWPSEGKPSGAFVEFWTTGQGVSLPEQGRDFQRALVASIVRLEQMSHLKPQSPR